MTISLISSSTSNNHCLIIKISFIKINNKLKLIIININSITKIIIINHYWKFNHLAIINNTISTQHQPNYWELTIIHPKVNITHPKVNIIHLKVTITRESPSIIDKNSYKLKYNKKYIINKNLTNPPIIKINIQSIAVIEGPNRRNQLNNTMDKQNNKNFNHNHKNLSYKRDNLTQ